MDDVAVEIIDIQNSQLSSEEKSMLLSSYSTENISLALEINQLSTTSSTADNAQDEIAQPKEVRDAISHRKEESPSLPSPQQPKAQPSTDEKSPSDENAPPSDNSSAATATSQKVELQGEDNHSKEKMKGDRDNLIDDDHGALEKIEETLSSKEIQKQGEDNDSKEKMKSDRYNLIDDDHGALEKIEETLSSKEIQKQPKENVAPGPQLNLNETLATDETLKDIPHTPSETDLEEFDQAVKDINASSQVVRSLSRRILLEVQEPYYIIQKDGGNSNDPLDPQDIINSSPNILGNEEAESFIPIQKAACRCCNRLITDDEQSSVLNAECKCTKMSLIHKDCMDAWFQEKRDNCSHCDDQIRTMKVKMNVSSVPSHVTCKRSWCCLC